MFIIGELKDAQKAEQLVSTLSKMGIETKLEVRDQEVYGIFVLREEDVPRALDYFRVAMGFPAPREIPEGFLEARKVPLGIVTKVLLGISILTYLLKLSPDHVWIIEKMFFEDPYEKETLLLKIREGQLWRLITPIFIHFNFLHILFNGMWLFDLGRIIENKLGKTKYLSLVFALGILSNFGQFAMTGPLFGGLSGVVFGFLGFVWVFQGLNPEGPEILPKHDVVLMVIWFFLCLFGAIPAVANMAHALGLSGGIAYAYIHHVAGKKKIEWSKQQILAVILASMLPILTFIIDYWKNDGKIHILQF